MRSTRLAELRPLPPRLQLLQGVNRQCQWRSTVRSLPAPQGPGLPEPIAPRLGDRPEKQPTLKLEVVWFLVPQPLSVGEIRCPRRMKRLPPPALMNGKQLAPRTPKGGVTPLVIVINNRGCERRLGLPSPSPSGRTRRELHKFSKSMNMQDRWSRPGVAG